jgi:hypothetical protein
MKQLTEIRANIVVLACVFTLSALGCGGGEGGEGAGGAGGGAGGAGGGAGGTGGTGGEVETPIDVTATGRVGLGTIGGATIDVYTYDDLQTPLVSLESSTGTLAETGGFSFEIDQVLPSDLFLLVVTGGEAVDVDEDGVIDAISTTNTGTFHCVATAAQLNDGDFFVSVMSELIYWRLRYYIGAEYDGSFVAAAADSWATHVLSSSIDGNDEVDWQDVLAFDGTIHQDQTIRPYSLYTPTALNVLGGAPLHVPAFDLTQAEIFYADLPGNGRGVALVDGRMYFGSNDGLTIYDVSDPTSPIHLGSHAPAVPFEIHVVDDLAYVADSNAGLQILDVSNPGAIMLAGAVPIPSAHAVEVVGDLAYVMQASFDDAMIHVVDVGDPGTASIVGSVPISGTPRDLAVHGSYVYVAKSSSRIEIIDVSDSANPESLGDALERDRRAGLAVVGDYLLATTDEGMEVLDIAEPEDPALVASVTIPAEGFAGSITVANGRAYLERSFDGVHVIDVSSPASPIRLGVLPVSSTQTTIAVEGTLMVTSDTNGGFHTAAAATPIASAAVAEVRLTGRARSVVATESHAYVGTGGPNELWAVDTSDPSAATRQVGLVLPSAANALQVRDELVFAATDSDGLIVIDVSNEAMPVVVGGDGTEQFLSTLTLGENTAYAGSGRELHVLDITTPTDPTPLTPVSLDRTAGCTASSGATLLICQDFTGVQAADLSVPTAPVLGTTKAAARNAKDIAMRSDKAFMADAPGNGIGAGVQVIDYSDYNAPTAESFLALPGNADQIAIGGEHAYVGVGAIGVQVANIADPMDMRHVGSLPLPADVRGVATAGDFVYAIGDHGLYVMRGTMRDVP